MKRIRDLLTYRANENDSYFTTLNAGGNHGPLYMEEAVITMDVKHNRRSRVLLPLGKMLHRIVGRLQSPCPRQFDENSDDIDLTVTPL